MGRGKDISLDLRMRVVKAYEEDGEGYKKLAKRFDIKVSSVQTIIKTYLKKKSEGLDPFEVVRPGRNRKTSARADCDIVVKAKKNPFITSK